MKGRKVMYTLAEVQANTVGDRALISSRSGKKALRAVWISALCLAVACWAILGMFGVSWIDEPGILHEPLFGLIPISFALLGAAILLAAADILIKVLNIFDHN